MPLTLDPPYSTIAAAAPAPAAEAERCSSAATPSSTSRAGWAAAAAAAWGAAGQGGWGGVGGVDRSIDSVGIRLFDEIGGLVSGTRRVKDRCVRTQNQLDPSPTRGASAGGRWTTRSSTRSWACPRTRARGTSRRCVGVRCGVVWCSVLRCVLAGERGVVWCGLLTLTLLVDHPPRLIHHVIKNQNNPNQAYRKLALKNHPDKGGDPEKFKVRFACLLCLHRSGCFGWWVGWVHVVQHSSPKVRSGR
jgi:hypothetical protein